MSYRKKSDPELLWLKNNRYRLVVAGMSPLFLDNLNLRRWHYVLGHSYHPCDESWSVESLTHQQRCKLLEILREFYHREVHMGDLISDIELMIAKNDRKEKK